MAGGPGLIRFQADEGLARAIDEWRAWLEHERRASPHTLSAYGRDLAAFLEFASEHLAEVPLLIKTRAAIYSDVEAAIKSLHPYELPEIVAVPIKRGLPDFLEWINAETVTEIG